MSSHLKINVAKSLEAVNEQFNNIALHEDIVPAIEIDILKEKVRTLYEHITAYQRHNEQSAVVHSRKREFETPVKSEKIIPEKAVIEKALPTQRKNDIELPEAPQQQVPQELNNAEPKTATTIQPLSVMPPSAPQKHMPHSAKKTETPVTKPKPVASLFDSTSVVGTMFDEKKSVGDKIADSNQTSSVANNLTGTKIEDLKKAIGINEKFLFINELFEGSMQAYTDTIEKLNQVSNLEQALQLLEPMQMKYNWNESQPAYLKMMELVKRRVRR